MTMAEPKLTPAQARVLSMIRRNGGAMSRCHMYGPEAQVAHRLVEKGYLITDGVGTSSRGPFNQAVQDTLAFVIPDDESDAR
jgi:hypothetical protein